MDSILATQVSDYLLSSHQSSKESFTFSCSPSGHDQLVANGDTECSVDYHEHELFFDMDISLVPSTLDHNPHHHQQPTPENSHHASLDSSLDSNMDMGTSYYLPDAQEFEFSITFSEEDTSNALLGNISPADDLFYKGQLLPLHLPPRLRMVERLSSQESITTAADNEEGNNVMSCKWVPLATKLATCTRRNTTRAKRPNSTMQVMSNGIWINVTDARDANVFPDCYKDPTFKMCQEDVSWPTKGLDDAIGPDLLGWRIFLPGSRRSSSQKLHRCPHGLHDASTTNRRTEARKPPTSILKLRASASVLKSFFTAGELGRLQVKHHARSNGPDEEGAIVYKLMQGKDTITFSSSIQETQPETDKVINKAREYLHKYVKFFKSIYVLLAHKSHEQSCNRLLESSGSHKLEGIMSTCSSFSSSSWKRKQGNGIDGEPKPLTRRLVMDSLRTIISLAVRPKTRSSMQSHNSDNQKVLLNMNEVTRDGCNSLMVYCDQESNPRLASCFEGESPIQGAIAHCKQSSTVT